MRVPRETRDESGGAVQAPGAAYQARLAAIAETHAEFRTRVAIVLVIGLVSAVAVSVAGAFVVAPINIVITGAIATLMWRVGAKFRPLPAELLVRGRATPAVILGARAVGPGLRGSGFPDGQRAQRQVALRIEVRPPSAHAYEVVLTTFDAPRPEGLEGRSVTVYVDPADPGRICPDWRTFDAEY